MSVTAVANQSGFPLEVPLDPACPFSQKHQNQIIWALLILGLVARSVRYFLKFPLWDDECFLMANLLNRGYLELNEPLNYWQICPVGFLWLELALSRAFGFCEYALRLPSFVCSVASLFIFRYMAARLLKGTSLLMAVGIFAVAYPLIRYSAEAKPYGIDMFLSLVLFTMAIEWWLGGARRGRWLWAMAVLAPVGILLSYPLVFMAGGVSLFVGYVLYREPQRRGWTAWAVFNLALLGAFAAIYLISIQPQSSNELSSMRAYWDRGFPPLAEPLGMIGWFFKVHTGQMLAYPFGGNNGGSILTFMACAVGLTVLARRRQYSLLLLLLSPLALTFAAAAMGRYPYGGMVRFNIYMAPAICLLAGLGLAAFPQPLRWRAATHSRSAVMTTVAILAIVAAVSIARDVAFPAKAATDMRFRDFARWFWFDMAHDGELVCLKSDLGKDFSPDTFQHGFSAMYLCNQRIYSPRHARVEPPQWDSVSADWPLRCVQFKSSLYEYDSLAFDKWLQSMETRYELVARDRYPFACYDKRETKIRTMTYVEVYKFVPKADPPKPTVTAK